MLSPLAPPAENRPLDFGQWMVLAAAFLGWMFDGLQLGLFPIAARPALIDLMHNQNPAEALFQTWISYYTALFLLGAAAGGFIFGWLGDRIGRVKSMTISILAYSGFTGLCYFATAPWQLGLFRFLCALGMGGEWALGVALVMECWPEKYRPLLAGVIGAAANVGFLLISVVGVLFKITPDSWRWIMGVGALPGFLAIFVIFFVPESKRWQESVRKATKSPVREVLTPPLLRPTLLAIVFCSVALIGTWGAVSGFLPSWADKLAGPQYPGVKSFIQLVVSIGCILGCLVGPPVSNRIGRRGGYFALCVVSLAVTQFLFRWFDQSRFDSHYPWFVFMAFVAGLTTASFYGLLPLYLPELYPTRVRATGQGLSFNFGRILAAGGALLGPRLGDYAPACAAITLVYVVGMAVIWFAPETSGRPLPE
jgi:MFS family permease